MHGSKRCRAEYVAVTDEAALDAFRELNRLEGILLALEPSHALAYAEFSAHDEQKSAYID